MNHDVPSQTPTKPHNPMAGPVVFSTAALILSGLALTVSVVGGPALGQYLNPLKPFNTAENTNTPHFQLASHNTSPQNNQAKVLFSNSSELIADVAENIAPSVVNIDIKKTNHAVQASPFNDEFFQRFFGLNPGMQLRQFPQQSPIIRGNGSGVIISADGTVLTNNHVVNGADEITVTTNDGKKYPAKVTGRDPYSDLAVVKMQGAHNLKPAELGNSSHLRPGEWVIAVGSPLGFDHTVTLGIVSALSRQVPDINANVEFIQTDAAINPGNSGGPLVNLNGQVIGINTAIAGSGQNIGFAIPVDVAKRVLPDLVRVGHVTRPWVGISMTALTPDLAKSLGIAENTQGIVVAQVLPNSPSARAGFQQGDVIQRIDGKVVTNPKEVQDMIRNKPVNTHLNFQVLRNGQMDAIALNTESLPDNALTPSAAQQQEDQEP